MFVQDSSRSNRILFWSLLLLGTIAVIAVLFVVLRYGFGNGIHGDTSLLQSTTAPNNEEQQNVPMTEEVLMGWKRDEQNHVSVTGRVMEVLPIPEQTDIHGVEIQLLVLSIIDPELYPLTQKSYRYFLSSRDTKDFYDSIAVDDVVTVTSIAPPTEESYLVGEKVEKEL